MNPSVQAYGLVIASISIKKNAIQALYFKIKTIFFTPQI